MSNKKHWSEDFDKVCIPLFFIFSITSVSLNVSILIPHILRQGAHTLEAVLVGILATVCCLMVSFLCSGVLTSAICKIGNSLHKNKLSKEKKKENKLIEFENWIRGCRIRKESK